MDTFGNILAKPVRVYFMCKLAGNEAGGLSDNGPEELKKNVI